MLQTLEILHFRLISYMPNYKPCLIIIFNHKFDRNIEVLEKLYRPRFKHIYFLVPFYTGTNPNVIPVYESSYYFQGYMAQGFRTFYKPDFTHYFFIGDDLILNPALNETNYAELMGLDEGTSYISELKALHEHAPALTLPNADTRGPAFWNHTFQGITFHHNRLGTQAIAELPTHDEALRLLAAQGVHPQPLSYYNVFGPQKFGTVQDGINTIKNIWTYYISWRRFKVNGNASQLLAEYPLAYSYSDVAIISGQVIQQFCHLCGVLSAMGLFVEMAVPTALALAGGRIQTDATSPLKGQPLWLLPDIDAQGERYSYQLTSLLADFPAGQLYHHPIKLSKWKMAN